MQTQSALVEAGHYCGGSAAHKAPELAAIRAEATDWLLLAQIGSDDSDDGLMWAITDKFTSGSSVPISLLAASIALT